MSDYLCLSRLVLVRAPLQALDLVFAWRSERAVGFNITANDGDELETFLCIMLPGVDTPI